MGIISVFYAALGYLALLSAILWGMLFVGDGVDGSLMDAPATVKPFEAILIDLGLLLLLALLHRLVGRGMARQLTGRSIPRGLVGGSQAWAAALALAAIYAGWQPVPQTIWNASGPLESGIVGLFYLAWTLILIGAFLPSQTAGSTAPPENLFASLYQPLYAGILLAMWTTSSMSAGHLLLAVTVTAYLLFDSAWEARGADGARAPHRTFSFQRTRVTG
jgi:hypothetical protein